MSSTDYSGWAIRRNGSCLLSQEVDCGATLAPFRACCPSSTVCPSQYNVACCPSGTNCTTTIVETPRCANESWAMFDNAGFFCCETNQVGYNRSNTDGCLQSGTSLPDDALPLAVVEQSSASSTISSTTTGTTSTTSTATSTVESGSGSSGSSSSSSPAGAIAGGVVGGIAAIMIVVLSIWFFRRRRNQNEIPPTTNEPPVPPTTDTPPIAAPYNTPYNEKYAGVVAPHRSEIDGNSRSELATDPYYVRSELP
ncbi:uncharacterized protein GGS25DRAFT_482903 [Hypoxylon fragiforme]|uniref:uncharacterized protein n=1 Tax=Hypoxylon fragiforme TaxID=63214 RepID=UPI0020C6878C|nr:uncharacterized protein GGS25DRAFT_482903 [Hypoxylon fragiforme]KAI2611492.1 hypothetical protein GGS25DRAFT_482903 [Hypoxylon fragiforme]